MMVLRFFAGLFVGFGVCVAFWQTWKYEREVAEYGVPLEKRPGRETVIWVSPMLLPTFFIILFVGFAVVQDFGFAADAMQEFLLELMVTLVVYYAVLFCLLPLFRRLFSARACAVLWLLPVYLYWMRQLWVNNHVEPLLVLRIPRPIMKPLVIVWAVGAAGTAAWKIISHLVFRKQVLLNVKPVGINDISRLWEREQERIERKKPIPLLISPNVASPLTIGVFSWSMRTVLPEKTYTLDELELIFRHELRHVQRRDVDTKIMLAFCEAICWFNPLMWLASKRAIADMELSCDEMVVYGKNEQERKRYASLLLNTAGNDRGFTTCLSASAKTLRYRLKNVVQQRKRFPGAIFLGIMTMVLIMSTGQITVTADYGSVEEVIFQPAQIGELESVTVKRPGTRGYSRVYGWDEEKLLSCLRELPVTWIGRDSDDTQEHEQELLLVFHKEQGGFIWVDIMDDQIEVSGNGSDLYRLDQDVDWDQIWSCLDFDAENPDPAPIPPNLCMYFDGVNPGEPMYANAHVASKTDPEGVYVPEEDTISWGGIHGYDCGEVFLEFTYDPIEWSIFVEGKNQEEPYHVFPEEKNLYTLELAPYSARYTVSGTFNSHRNTIYEMKFYFEVELPDES